MKRAKYIRANVLRELNEKIRKSQATSGIVVEYFNKDAHSKNMKEFTIEIGLHDTFSEVHDVEKKRYGTFEYGSKCIVIALMSEEMLKIVEVIELIECDEIVYSDYREYLINLNL